MSRPAPTLFRRKHIEHQSYSLMRDLSSLFLPVRATSNSGRKRREIEHKIMYLLLQASQLAALITTHL